MTVCDAHLHASLLDADSFRAIPGGMLYRACACSHSRSEFLRSQEVSGQFPGTFVQAFGMHPQNPVLDDADFLEELLSSGRVTAVGECGFDFYEERFRQNRPAQEEAWRFQLELAARHGVPIVVHDRKALDPLFRDAALLGRISAVVMHSFAFGPREAASLLSHGINAYFSFGKQILNGNKRARLCVESIPRDRLLLETDAPFQKLRGEDGTEPADILRVYREAALLLRTDTDEILAQCDENFTAVFGAARV